MVLSSPLEELVPPLYVLKERSVLGETSTHSQKSTLSVKLAAMVLLIVSEREQQPNQAQTHPLRTFSTV